MIDIVVKFCDNMGAGGVSCHTLKVQHIKISCIKKGGEFFHIATPKPRSKGRGFSNGFAF